ncbi:hypothetical protein [Sphingomonas sp. URHD0057]|uniref:hypothetical protein n=1 Tax=Sphingomonas sp. URHD0057 TaxID=1380389 RepID=UPI0012DEB09A|nr:hypothetical protein [Sphingomonas sp. URHD0057]
MVLILIGLWLGSAIAGWFLFWPWLAVPLAVIGLYVMRFNARLRAARERNGLPIGGTGFPGTSMVGPNVKLLVMTLAQHLAIFGAAAALHWMVG